MATLCKNCGAGLNYDPKSKKMFCSSCGSFFRAEEDEFEKWEREHGNDIDKPVFKN